MSARVDFASMARAGRQAGLDFLAYAANLLYCITWG